MLLPSGNPFKCHEEVLSLTAYTIPPTNNKRFDIFSPDWGMLRRSRRVQIFLQTPYIHVSLLVQTLCIEFISSWIPQLLYTIIQFVSESTLFLPTICEAHVHCAMGAQEIMVHGVD